MSKITHHLLEIEVEASKLGVDLAANMNPPSTAGQVAAATKRMGIELPNEILDLYRWKNGVRLNGQPWEIRMFPRFYFLSLERSIETTNLLVATVGEKYSGWQDSWFALCSDLGGDYYAINTARIDETFGRVFSIQEECVPFAAFWSFETMLRSVLECYRAGAYYLDEDGLLQEDKEKAGQIYRQFNKGLSPYYCT